LQDAGLRAVDLDQLGQRADSFEHRRRIALADLGSLFERDDAKGVLSRTQLATRSR
jgi:hypothetical protein